MWPGTPGRASTLGSEKSSPPMWSLPLYPPAYGRVNKAEHIMRFAARSTSHVCTASRQGSETESVDLSMGSRVVHFAPASACSVGIEERKLGGELAVERSRARHSLGQTCTINHGSNQRY